MKKLLILLLLLITVPVFAKENKVSIVAEETDFWGNPTDIISMLIGDFYSEKSHIEEYCAPNVYMDFYAITSSQNPLY